MNFLRTFWRWYRKPEIIGPPDCPLMRRWTIAVNYEGQRQEAVLIRAPRWFGYKIMIHHFLPNTEDADPHDHPRSLWTLILKGAYQDLVPCSYCQGERYPIYRGGKGKCPVCNARGVELGEEMTPGRFRHRPAQHRHITKVSTAGAWTLCVMGPKERAWGFWRDLKFWQWEDYEREYGLSFRCDSNGDRVVEVSKPQGGRGS